MAGNTFGTIFRVTTFGESHGAAVGCVVDGVPPRLPLCQVDIQRELDRRRPGQSAVTTPRQESDCAEILSGVLEEQTTGTPLTIIIRNQNQWPKDYEAIRDVFRPGHGDFTWEQKFGIRDHRGGGRSSGRETAGRVAAGAVAKQLLRRHGISVIAYTRAVGSVQAREVDVSVIEHNAVRAPDMAAAAQMIALIGRVQEQGDSIGGMVEAVIRGCPPGLGDPVFDKLNARLAHAIMSIAAIKGLEFGDGFAVAAQRGSEHNDVFVVQNGAAATQTNHGGGILGGISTGGDIVLRAAVKPPSSIAMPQQTLTRALQPTQIAISGRHDPCLCPRMVPVIEAMIALVLADCLLLQQTVRGCAGAAGNNSNGGDGEQE